jgi:hypothetical protein
MMDYGLWIMNYELWMGGSVIVTMFVYFLKID